MQKNIFLIQLLVLIFFLPAISFAQNNPKWDDTKNKDWPLQFQVADIPSTVDNKIQKAYF